MKAKTKTPKELWLEEYSSEGTINLYSRDFDLFCEWAKTNDVELVEEYQAAKNKKQWAKEKGAQILRFYNYLVTEKGYVTNTARSKLSGIRAFLTSQCETPKIKKGAVPRAKIALGEHEFTLSELKRMFFYGDVRQKAILSTAIALGWGAQDFITLKREFIESYLEKEAFTGFWYERKKTGAICRGHLTPESIESLKAWLAIATESEWVWSNGSGTNHISDDTLNNILKDMVKKANIQPTGKVHFHLIRKYLLSQLSNAGINQAHVKVMVGKQVPPDLMTYMQGLTDQLRTEYIDAYERFSLIGYANRNHDRIEALETEVNQLRQENEFMKGMMRMLFDKDKTNQVFELMKKRLSREDYENWRMRFRSFMKPKNES